MPINDGVSVYGACGNCMPSNPHKHWIYGLKNCTPKPICTPFVHQNFSGVQAIKHCVHKNTSFVINIQKRVCYLCLK